MERTWRDNDREEVTAGVMDHETVVVLTLSEEESRREK